MHTMYIRYVCMCVFCICGCAGAARHRVLELSLWGDHQDAEACGGYPGPVGAGVGAPTPIE